jgi:transketolase
MIPEDKINELKKIARELRVDIINMLVEAGSGHPGGSLSAIDILTCLYFHFLRHDPQNPHWPARDRFVLSKGHAVPAVYACLAKAGYFPKSELLTLRKINSRLQGHPDRVKLPGLEASTGSLGQGLSIAIGLAIASKLDGDPFRVYCMLGDGETQAGQIWEGLMSAPKFKLDNLVTILDYNKGQIDGPTNDIMNLEPIMEKVKAFNWHVIEIDGHDYVQIFDALESAQKVKGQPTFILAQTVKGKGVSFMEGQISWHGKAPSREQGELAVKEILVDKS